MRVIALLLGCDLSGGSGHFLSALVEAVAIEAGLLEALENANPPGVLLTFLSCFRIELRALGKISEGEELTVSYIDFLHLSEERRRQLKKQYYFDCSCEHCQKGLKDDLFLAAKEDPKVHTTLLQGPRLPSQELGKGGMYSLEGWRGMERRAGQAGPS